MPPLLLLTDLVGKLITLTLQSSSDTKAEERLSLILSRCSPTRSTNYA